VAGSTRDAACTGELRELVMEPEEENSDDEVLEAGELNMLSGAECWCRKLRCQTSFRSYIYVPSWLRRRLRLTVL
jgi:hypothetical protein